MCMTYDHFYAMERLRGFLTFRLSDLITTLPHVLMENFYPCFSLKIYSFLAQT